jgi:transposase
MSKYKRYSAEFKREAIRLLESGDKSATDVAIDLGIRRNQLYKWQRSLRKKGDKAFPGSGSNPSQQSEVVRLKRELERVTEERDILKKAAAYFARESQ